MFKITPRVKLKEFWTFFYNLKNLNLNNLQMNPPNSLNPLFSQSICTFSYSLN
jgi:hypothetical protein